jgi:hypothetical protein
MSVARAPSCASSIFALTLQPQQRPHDRRPAEYSDIGEMEDIVESIVVSRHRVVGQPIADIDAIAALEHIGLAVHGALEDVDV